MPARHGVASKQQQQLARLPAARWPCVLCVLVAGELSGWDVGAARLARPRLAVLACGVCGSTFTLLDCVSFLYVLDASADIGVCVTYVTDAAGRFCPVR
jgi:hypothetical protein